MPEPSGETSGTVPAIDQNIASPAAVSTGTANPPIPAELAQQTPEFLTSLISDVDTLRQAQSELFAKMYPPMRPGQSNAPAKPPYEELIEYRRQDLEYDVKIAGLRGQIQELHVLLARPPSDKPAPELSTAPPPEASSHEHQETVEQA